jgi:dTDP-4-dehydrorhamnose reductase
MPVPSSAFSSTAQRPKNSRLDGAKLQATFDLRMPPWQTGIVRMLSEVLEK